MKKLLWLLLLIPAWAHSAPCPVTTGTLTLSVSQPRTSAVSPFLAFFDATATTTTATLGGAGTVFQDVYFAWNFGDTGTSGSGTWSNGATGQNQKNIGTGPVAAHNYVLPVAGTADTTYTVQVWAFDGNSIATCTVTVTVQAPSGTNGFPSANTTCVFNTTLGTGCPAGANQTVTNSISTALAAIGNGKRVLFKCGDTFTGSGTVGPTKASIGVYGGCENTATSRPIMSNGSINLNGTTVDLRVADLDFEDNAQTQTAINATGNESQLTLYNLNCVGDLFCYKVQETTQSGLIGSLGNVSAINGTTIPQYAVFWNYAENNCVNNSAAFNCGGTPNFVPVAYQAIIGNNITGPNCHRNATGPCSSGAETSRTSACRFCIFSNNTFQNSSGSWGSTFKLHSGNTFNSNLGAGTWLGQYTEYVEISDNIFQGGSGATKLDISPQNDQADERMRFIVFERNLVIGSTATDAAQTKLLFSVQNGTLRNNVFFLNSGVSGPTNFNMEVSRRPQTSVVGTNWPTQFIEVYNNTCYSLTAGPTCVGFVQVGADQANEAAKNSFAANNLHYNAGSAGTAVNNGGTGNTVNNNTANSALNPSMSNGSGNFSSLGDFRPGANATGASSSVPNYFDAFQFSWALVYQLGALSQGAP